MSRLWDFVQGHQQLDPDELQKALNQERQLKGLDWRTRRLMLECRAALDNRPVRGAKFPSLPLRLRAWTKVETINSYLRELDRSLTSDCRLMIGGATSLILSGLLRRGTENIDVVDEIPGPIRNLHRLQEELKKEYGLYIAHFQSHYLPQGWEGRLISYGSFRRLQVQLVDPMDVFVGKVSSKRMKARSDLRALEGNFCRETLKRRFLSATNLRSDPLLLEAAEKNWYVVFGEELPV